MLSHGGHARELNLWASKLRNYQSKHFQNVDRTPRYALYCPEASNKNELTLGSQTTDLQCCVQLLSHMLEMDGSLMGGPTARRRVPKRAVKSKKKRVHVVPQPKLPGKGSLAKGSHAKSGCTAKKTNVRVNGQREKSRFQTNKTGAATVPNDGNADEDHFMQPPPCSQKAGSDVSEPVPYNTRLASSTPNNTLLKEQNSDYPVLDTVGQAKDPGLSRCNVPTTSTKQNTHDCKQFSKNAPDLPLVFLNMDYNLTPGQSNPLNSSSQVNIIEPLEAEPVPKLIQGHVEFRPNPSPWFHTNRSNAPASCDVHQDTSPKPWLESCDIQETRPVRGCQLEPDQAAYPLDPPEREVNFSLYTNNGDCNGGDVTERNGTPPSNAVLAVHQMAAHNGEPTSCQQRSPSAGNGKNEKCDAQVKGSSNSCNANVIKIPTALRKSSSETKVKRLAKKDSTSTGARFTKSDKKKQSIKSRDNVFKKSKFKVDKAVQFTINNAATQCSPERISEQQTELLNLLNTCTDPCMSHQSMRHMMALQCLLEEMKSVVKSEQNSKLDLLMKQVGQTAAMFVPGLGGIDWHTELELAVQPLRSENAQLRRRLRISSQQMRETKYQLEHTKKPDPSFHTVHLELLQQKLQQDYNEMKSSRDKLMDRLKDSQNELDKVRAERAKLLEIMVNKDTERRKAEQKWTEDGTRHRRDTERALEETNRALRERDLLEKQLQLVHISLDQRDKEIARLRNIVRNLQDSMKGLLSRLKCMTPSDEFVDSFTDGDGNNLLDNDVLLVSPQKRFSDYNLDNDHTPTTNCASSGHASVRRVLPFAVGKPQMKSSTGKTHQSEATSVNGESLNLISSPRQETGQEKTDKEEKTADDDDDKWDDDSLNYTDYITAPGTSPMKKISSGRRIPSVTVNQEKSSGKGAPTVKELLTPLKDRMQTQYKRLSAGSQGKSHGGSTDLPSVSVVPEEDFLDDLEVAPLDSTLCDGSDNSEDETLQENVAQDEGDMTANKVSSDEVSRYSITDYFRKYQHENDDALVKGPEKDRGRHFMSNSSDGNIDENDNLNGINDNGIDPNYGQGGHQHLNDIDRHHPDLGTSDSRKTPTQSSSDHGLFQESTYKGTALETSISTISDAESITSSVMTLSSIGTIDDSNFQQGLADLDANIARIQAQLQASLAQYS